jgi:hypothetical protein
MSLVTPAFQPSSSVATGPVQRRVTALALWVDRFGLVAILTGFLLLGFWYSLSIPPFETPDEVYHYAFARHLAQGGGLPVQGAEATGPWQQEGSQAPLYYWIVGRLTAAIDQSDFDQLAVFNPRSNMGDPLYPGNKNRMLYSATYRGLGAPLTGANLALHIARWFSLAVGAVTIWCVARIARLAFAPDSRLALLPPLLVAVIPQFVFISASCSNDSLVIAAGAATLWWLARLLARADRTPIALWEWAMLGLLLGVAALSKLQGLGLWLLAAGTGLALVWRRRDPWLPLRALLPVALPALAVAGWWYWRNVTLYGDWFGIEHLMSINGRRTEPLEWDEWWLEFRGLRYSFWGLFGWFNLLLPQWVYWLLDGLTLAALVGLAPALWWGRGLGSLQRVRWLLVAWTLLSAALVVYWMMQATGSQGRLFFPAIGAVAVLWVLGLESWLGRLPSGAAAALRAGPPLLLLGCTLYAGMVLFPASYAAPRPIATIPATAQPVNLTFGENMDAGERIELLAIDPPTGRYYAGDHVPVTLYLRTPAPLAHDYELFIQLLDEQGEVMGNVTTHPGWGRNPTRLWTPGAIYADAYTVQVRRRIDPRSPLLARLYTGFVNPEDEALAPLPAYTADGAEVTPFPAEVVLLPFSPADADDFALSPATARFGDGLALAGVSHPVEVEAGQPLTVTLLWEATAPLTTDYTAFVHLLGPDGGQVAGFDQAPGGERYPTRVWLAGDRVVSDFGLTPPVATPPGRYSLWAGVYVAGSGGAERLPVTEAGTLEAMHEMVRLGEVEIN